MRIDKRTLENITEWMQKREDIPSGWVYIGDDKERYILGQPGINNILVFGVNPSTASPGEKNLDPTIRKVRKMITGYGYDGWLMANLYPLRATNPCDLPKDPDKVLIEKNIKILEAVIEAYPIQKVWAAWGDTIDTRFYLGDALYDIQDELKGEFQWFYRGELTKRGNPRHPLYMRKDEKYERFSISDYSMRWKFMNEKIN